LAKTITPTRPSCTSICLSPKLLQLHYTETLQRRGKDGVLQSPKCYRCHITSTEFNAHSNFARLKLFDISDINVILFSFLDFSSVIFSVVDLAFIHIGLECLTGVNKGPHNAQLMLRAAFHGAPVRDSRTNTLP
jgi:hypothetical protein